MFIEIFLVLASVLFALQAIRAPRLIVAALWLAGTSALVSVILYLAGATLAAVIELSVGAGLVTVLFAFAISVAGEDTVELGAKVPKVLGGALALIAMVLIAWLIQPGGAAAPAAAEAAVSDMIWQVRGLDVLVQIVLIFAGVLGLLGLLAEEKAPLQNPYADEFIAKRNLELKALQERSLKKERV